MLLGSFEDWLEFLGAVGRLVIEFFREGTGEGDEEDVVEVWRLY